MTKFICTFRTQSAVVTAVDKFAARRKGLALLAQRFDGFNKPRHEEQIKTLECHTEHFCPKCGENFATHMDDGACVGQGEE